MSLRRPQVAVGTTDTCGRSTAEEGAAKPPWQRGRRVCAAAAPSRATGLWTPSQHWHWVIHRQPSRGTQCRRRLPRAAILQSGTRTRTHTHTCTLIHAESIIFKVHRGAVTQSSENTPSMPAREFMAPDAGGQRAQGHPDVCLFLTHSWLCFQTSRQTDAQSREQGAKVTRDAPTGLVTHCLTETHVHK